MLIWIQQWLTYIMLAIIAILIVLLVVQTFRLNLNQNKLKTTQLEKWVIQEQLNNSQSVLRQLANETEELSIRLKDSQTQAKKEKDKRDASNDNLGKEVVPTDCEGATQWAKDKSKEISGKW